MYRDLGLDIAPADNAVESGIESRTTTADLWTAQAYEDCICRDLGGVQDL